MQAMPGISKTHLRWPRKSSETLALASETKIRLRVSRRHQIVALSDPRHRICAACGAVGDDIDEIPHCGLRILDIWSHNWTLENDWTFIDDREANLSCDMAYLQCADCHCWGYLYFVRRSNQTIFRTVQAADLRSCSQLQMKRALE